MLVQFFVWQGKLLFDVVNPLIVILLIMEIYWISNKGEVSLNFKASRLCFIFAALWLFTPSFPNIYLWLTASCNYLWTTVILLAFLIPYVKKYFDDSFKCSALVMLVSGIIAGWTNENTVCWFILVIAIMVYKRREKWLIAGLIGLCTGYALLIFAPGNMERLHISEASHSIEQTDIFNPIVIFGFALVVQFVLWYFLIGTFRYSKHFGDSDNVKCSMQMIKVFALISLAADLIMFIPPEFPVRSMFPSLVYLLIAVTTSIRLQEEIGISQLTKGAAKFLRIAAITALSINICATVMGLSTLHKYYTLTYGKEAPLLKYPLYIKRASFLHLPGYIFSSNVNHWVHLSYLSYYELKKEK